MKLDFSIIISDIKDKIFSKKYELNLKENFVKDNKNKSSGLRNNIDWFINKLKISSNIDWFINKLKISSNIDEKKDIKFYKWSIYYVDFGINIGSEINGTRLALIYKNGYFSQGKDIIVIPFTSLESEKLIDKFDVVIKNGKDNNLDNESLLKIRQLKVISKKRIGEFKGFMNNNELRIKIDKKVKKMLGLK